MNVITIAGNIGRDGELRQAGDYPVLNFPVASSKKIKGVDKTTWFDCALFGNRATSLAQYIKKGGQVVVTGECSLETYQKGDGSEGSKIRVNLNDVKLMGSKQDNQQAQQPQQNYQPQRPANPNQPAPQQAQRSQQPAPQNYQNQPNPANHPAPQPAGGSYDAYDDSKPPF